MPNKTLRAVLSLVVVVGAVAFFMAQSLGENVAYFKEVDEVMVDPEQWYDKNMNLHGYVVPGSIERKPNSLDWRFQVRNGAHVVRATYTGVVPDTFNEEAEVVLKGRLSPEGFHVEKDGVVAKCPSKYEQAVGQPGTR